MVAVCVFSAVFAIWKYPTKKLDIRKPSTVDFLQGNSTGERVQPSSSIFARAGLFVNLRLGDLFQRHVAHKVVHAFMMNVYMNHGLRRNIRYRYRCGTPVAYDVRQKTVALFRRCGELCSRYPVAVIAVSLVAIGALTAGVVMIDIVTDPIQLWAAPLSRSRIEKDFFDSHFKPFYRNTQIIIKVKDGTLTKFNYTNVLGEVTEFGPVFHKEFLLDVLGFQKAVEGIVTPDGVALSDVCNAPLSPTSGACNIQTIWAYWQDDPAEFNKSAVSDLSGHLDTYLDHFILCSGNPASPAVQTAMAQGCMSKGGIPVQPKVVLGGYGDGKPEGQLEQAHPEVSHIFSHWEFLQMAI